MNRQQFEEEWNRIDTFYHDVKVYIGTHEYIGYLITNRYKIHTDKYYGYSVVSFYNYKNQGYKISTNKYYGDVVSPYNDGNQGHNIFIADIILADIYRIEKV
jgi:hypothetical protein